MSEARTATGMDRLPWLSDEPSPPRRRASTRDVAGWVLAAALLVAGAFYWISAHSGQEAPAPAPAVRSSTTVPLPPPRVAQPPQPQVTFEASPKVSPAPLREVPVARPRVETTGQSSVASPMASEPAAARVEETPVGAASAPVPAPQPMPNAIQKPPLTLWPATQSNGARGRIVRIGAFGSRSQAKLGWRYMVEAYPAVAHLPATVVESRNSRGRPFYRFQIGTTSQAHSEVLCQRMARIHLSCAVVGLPWRPTGVER